jgi:hypothetical protein
MIKREYGEIAQIGMVLVKNPFDKCLCGQVFDQDGVCNNKHFAGQEYFVPENQVRNNLEKKKIPVEILICRNQNNHCSICGAAIPEGDNICDHGHMLGVKYPN